VLGLLNLGALRRRLDLDFNDLFGSGYAFEKISGRFDIQIVTVTPHIGTGAAIAGAVAGGPPGRGGRLPGRSGIRWGDQLAGPPPVSPQRTLGRA